MKIINSLVLVIVLLCCLICPVSASGAPSDVSDTQISPRYTNISTTFLAADDTWVNADMTTHSRLSLSLTVKVYAEGTLENTFKETATGKYIELYEDYNFESGVRYKITCTFKAGSESTTRTIYLNP